MSGIRFTTVDDNWLTEGLSSRSMWCGEFGPTVYDNEQRYIPRGYDVVNTTTLRVAQVSEAVGELRFTISSSEDITSQSTTGQTIVTASMRHTAPVTHQFSLSTVEVQGRVHTGPLITTSFKKCSPLQEIAFLDHVLPAAGMAPVNHAYLCMDVAGCVIRPKMITFSNSRLASIYTTPVSHQTTSDIFYHVTGHNEGASTARSIRYLG